jgi:hypothetical protein
MDVDDIAPGQKFAQVIETTIASCEVLLAIIGPRWMEILRKRSQEQPHDYVCREIQTALARGIRIIPVLVGGASMAQFTSLPAELAGLSSHHAAELRDSTFKEDCITLAKSLNLQPMPETPGGEQKTSRRKPLIVLGGAVIIGLLLTVVGFIGMGPWSEYRERKAMLNGFFATARSQAERAEYESAFNTYINLLRIDPSNRAAMELQVDAAMRWVQDFHVLVSEGSRAEDIAGPRLAEIMSVLDAGLARANGNEPRTADILAHLGWAHWLNQRMAYKEFGPAAERDMRRALNIDTSNVFAHAMLGNWLIQTHGDTAEALLHFHTAVKTGRERPFVRRMQLGAMVYNSDPRIRSELIRTVNEMRISGEPVGDPYKRRILSAYSSGDELNQLLSAVPPKDAWATFLWLDDRPAEGSELDQQRIRRGFIHASILEIDGKRAEALQAFVELQRELKQRGYVGRLAAQVADAVQRLK